MRRDTPQPLKEHFRHWLIHMVYCGTARLNALDSQSLWIDNIARRKMQNNAAVLITDLEIQMNTDDPG